MKSLIIENGVELYVITTLGRQEYRLVSTGQIHREGDLPAVISEGGSQYWVHHGKLHRLHGPALIVKDLYSKILQAWYYYGEHIPVDCQSDFEQWLKLKAF